MIQRKPGRPPRHGTAMVQKTVRLPQEWIDALCVDKTFQEAIEELVRVEVERREKDGIYEFEDG